MKILKNEIPELMQELNYECIKTDECEELNTYSNYYLFLHDNYPEIAEAHEEISMETLAYSIYYWITYVLKYSQKIGIEDAGLEQAQFQAIETIEYMTDYVDCDKLEELEGIVSEELSTL